MIYQNHDLNTDKFFLGPDSNIVTDISTLKHKPLSREIYFRPTNAPLINVANSSLGTCFQGYTIPTASYIYTDTEHGIVCTRQATDLNLVDYTNLVHGNIQKSIEKIYQDHNEVTLCYSGGIDSIVLLSYIIRYDLLSRTNIICFENHSQSSSMTMHNNQSNKEKVIELLDKIKPQVKSIQWLTFGVEDIANSFNHGRLEHLKCYTTNALLQRFHNTAFVFGNFGNQILLHKSVYVDELILQGSLSNDDLSRLLSSDANFYMQSLYGYNVDKEKVGFDQVHLLQKPWTLLDRTNDNRVYNPIGSQQNFDLVRSLDFQTVTFNDLANATVARKIMNWNVDTDLDEFVGVESEFDHDSLNPCMVPVSLLNPDLLTVPSTLTHHQEGVEYIYYELDRAKISGEIAVNTLTSIKMLNWIDQL